MSTIGLMRHMAKEHSESTLGKSAKFWAKSEQPPDELEVFLRKTKRYSQYMKQHRRLHVQKGVTHSHP